MAKQYAIGYNADVATSYEVLANNAGGVDLAGMKALAATAAAVKLASSSTDDDDGGTGALTVEVKWLDSNWKLQVSTITLDGQTDVAIGTAHAVISARVLTTGSGGTNAGIIDIGYGTNTSGSLATPVCTIAASANVSQQAVFGIPASRKAVIKKIYATGTDVDNTLKVVAIDELGQELVLAVLPLAVNGSELELNPDIEISEKHVVHIQAVTGADTEAITAGFTFIIK